MREEFEHVREGKHGARSTKQAIAIGLSKARRAGVDLPPPAPGKTTEKTRRSAELAATALRQESGLEVTWVVGGAGALEGPSGSRALRAAVILFAALVPPEIGLLHRVANSGAAVGGEQRTRRAECYQRPFELRR